MKTLALFSLLFCLPLLNMSQQPTQSYASAGTASEESAWKDKLEVGGNFGLQFSNTTTIFNFSPQIGYKLNPLLTLGTGLSYSYYHWKELKTPVRETQNYLGLNVFGRFNFQRFLRVQIQPEMYRYWGNFKNAMGNGYSQTNLVPSLLLGGGFYFQTTQRSGVVMMIYYDLLQNKYSPYGNDIIYSLGYSIGF